MNSTDYWEDRIANATWKTYNSIEDRNRELLELYQDASKSIREELYTLAEKHSKDGALSRSDLYKYNRLDNIKKSFEDTIKQMTLEMQTQTEQNFKQGFTKVYENILKELGYIQVKKPSENLMNELLDKPWQGGSFSERLWKNQKKLSAALNDVLLNGLLQGKTVFEVASNLNNIMWQGFNAAHRLVRTETMHYLNSAALRGYKDSGITHARLWVALDERTCEHCMKYHDKVYPIDKAPILPLHPHCRCTYLPVFEDELRKSIDKPGENSIISTLFEHRIIP